MKFLLVVSLLISLTACQSDQPIAKKAPLTSVKKAETIIVESSAIKNITIDNPAGKITTVVGDRVTAKFEKKKWREWCILSHIEKNGTLLLKVENTSITGQGGCEVFWTLTLPEQGHLKINQAAGMVTGVGALASLRVQLAAGNLEWKKGNMPLSLQVAAGAVNLKNMSFPAQGESVIEVGTGQISITSPKETPVTTTTTNAIGKEDNDFQAKQKGHLLKLKVAVGKVGHKAI